MATTTKKPTSAKKPAAKKTASTTRKTATTSRTTTAKKTVTKTPTIEVGVGAPGFGKKIFKLPQGSTVQNALDAAAAAGLDWGNLQIRRGGTTGSVVDGDTVLNETVDIYCVPKVKGGSR